MNFGRTDMMIIISMSLAIIIMTFMLPAMGFTDESNEATESDIPEFNVTSSRFDFAGDFPGIPNPSAGTLTRLDNKTGVVAGDDRQHFIDGNRLNGTRLRINGIVNNENITVAAQQMDGGGIIASDQVTLDTVGETKEILNSTTGLRVHVNMTERKNSGTDNVSHTVRYEIQEAPEDRRGFIQGVVTYVKGLIFSPVETVANVLTWIGATAYFFTTFTFEIALNAVNLFVDMATFGFDLMIFFTNRWTTILASASNFAAVIILLPMIILWLEWIKIVMILISLFPFT